MNDERHEATEDPAANPLSWSDQLRAELVAAARREVEGAGPTRRRPLCRHRRE